MKQSNVLKMISVDRERTNILKKWEQNAIGYFVKTLPSWVSSDMLTAFGFFGSIVISASFIMAAYINSNLLLLAVLGYAINWFGDSLDGRIAYFRNKPRKWYGFSLDVTVDWLGIMLMGVGFMIYVDGWWKFLGFGFVALYGWEMITALLRYKITGKYSIDNGILGPTEVRIIISAVLTTEVILPGSILYTATTITCLLFIANIFDMMKVLALANEKDAQEKKEKQDHVVFPAANN